MLEPCDGGKECAARTDGDEWMTIYGRRKGLMDFDKVQGALLSDPNRAEGPSASQHGRSRLPDDDVAMLRKSQPADRLLPMTEQWFNHIPRNVSPSALATQFPRIANILALQWADRRACAAYFDDLLADRRGGRQGFPPDVLQDLRKLRDYWYGIDWR
jgi:hypothetical protein